MRKSILLLALGMFLSASVTANACDHDKATLKTGKSSACCMKGAKAKSCMTKAGKDCTKDPSCMKDMKASKATKTAKKTAEKS